MKKFLMLVFIISLAPFIAGLYGVLHDQITYTISPEYYTKFKFIQFGLIEEGDVTVMPNVRSKVATVGFLATWWMGLPIGLILGLTGLIHNHAKQMFSVTMKSIFVTVLIAFFTGLLGLLYGKYYLADTGVDWWLPENLIDTNNFIAVGSMHNFSYFGGLAGLIGGIIYAVRQKHKLNSKNTNTQIQVLDSL